MHSQTGGRGYCVTWLTRVKTIHTYIQTPSHLWQSTQMFGNVKMNKKTIYIFIYFNILSLRATHNCTKLKVLCASFFRWIFNLKEKIGIHSGQCAHTILLHEATSGAFFGRSQLQKRSEMVSWWKSCLLQPKNCCTETALRRLIHTLIILTLVWDFLDIWLCSSNPDKKEQILEWFLLWSPTVCVCV